MKSSLQSPFSISGSLLAGDQLSDQHIFMGSSTFGNPIGHRSVFSDSGSLRMISGSLWDFAYVDTSNLRSITGVTPDWLDLNSQGYELPAFPPAVGKRINFSISIPGTFKTISSPLGLNIYVQMNMLYNNAGAGTEGQFSRWRLEYNLLGHEDTYAGYSILYKDIYYVDAHSSAYLAYGINNDGFILTNMDWAIGKTLLCMLTRIGTADTYEDYVYISGINFAIPVDSFGSDSPSNKSPV